MKMMISRMHFLIIIVSPECDKIPLFFYYKGMEASERDTEGSTSIALAPTILD